MDAARDDQRRRRFPVSASFLTNFSALVALFAAIALLQHVGGGVTASPAAPGDARPVASSAPPGIPDLGPTPSPGGAPVAAPAAEPLAEAEAPAPAAEGSAAEGVSATQVTVAALAPASPPADDEEPPMPAAEETPSPVPAPAPAPAPAPERAELAAKGTLPPRAAVARRQQKPRQPALPPPKLFDEDRAFDIGSLDNEAARQGYLAANRRLADSGSRGTSPAPAADDIPPER